MNTCTLGLDLPAMLFFMASSGYHLCSRIIIFFLLNVASLWNSSFYFNFIIYSFLFLNIISLFCPARLNCFNEWMHLLFWFAFVMLIYPTFHPLTWHHLTSKRCYYVIDTKQYNENTIQWKKKKRVKNFSIAL